jgi:hypothetical protein
MEIQSVMLVFWTSFVKHSPLTLSLVSSNKYTVHYSVHTYRMCGGEKYGVIGGEWVSDR